MQLTKEQSRAKYQIKKYTKGSVTVNDNNYSYSIIISPNYLAKWEPNDIDSIINQKPDIVIIGTGDRQDFDLLDKYRKISEHDIGLEIMSTPAACRTYMVLTAEDRNVIVALII